MIDFLLVDSAFQWMAGFSASRLAYRAKVSTSRNGLGELNGSYQTPRGLHVIRAKIGDGLPIYTQFKGRRPTGHVFQHGVDDANAKDWVLSRILWLQGLEKGFNRFGQVDTSARYIYFHGTAQEHLIGRPVSDGCIRLRNQDMMDLFDHVDVGTKVFIR